MVILIHMKSFWYEIELDPEVVNDTETKVRQFLLHPTYRLRKQKSGVEIDIRPLVLDLRVKDQCLMMHFGVCFCSLSFKSPRARPGNPRAGRVGNDRERFNWRGPSSGAPAIAPHLHGTAPGGGEYCSGVSDP